MKRPTTSLAVGTVIVATLFSPSGARAQEEPAVCQTQSAFREFDFWVGEWVVYNNATGELAGRNRIESRENGCVLVEQWNGRRGGSGISLNYYDRLSGTWRQVWVANGYSIDIVGGLDGEGAMVLEGYLHNYRSMQAVDFRGTWTLNPDGTVRQLFERRDPETGEWQVWFDGRYERQS